VSGFKEFVQTRKGTVLSGLLHVVVIGWGLVSFSTHSLEAPQPDFVPVDVISDDKLSEMMKGLKIGDKDQQKPLVEKQSDPKPVDDAVGKVIDRKPVIKPSGDKDQLKPEEKPPEKKPDPVAQDKPKDEPKVDQIAEKLKQQDQKKDPPKPEAKATPQPKPKKEYHFDPQRISSALTDKRDPTRESVTGEQLNPNSSVGTAAAQAQKNSTTWIGALQRRIASCWAVPAGLRDADTMQVRVQVRLAPNGMLQAPPVLVEAPPPSREALGPAFAESAIRAIEQCQPYNFLPQADYRTGPGKNGWDFMEMSFTQRDLFNR
jgi:colicin import membrane protein